MDDHRWEPNLYTCPRCGQVFDVGTDDLAGDEEVVRQRIAHRCVVGAVREDDSRDIP